MTKNKRQFALSGITAAVLLGVSTISAGADTAWTDRVGGSDRVDTAIEISQHIYPDKAVVGDTKISNPIGPNYVIIARSDLYPDALAGAGLITDVATITLPGAEPVDEDVWISNPVLITASDSLDGRVKDEIERLQGLGRGTTGAKPGLSGSQTTNEKGTQIYVLGEEDAISDKVIDQLEKISGVSKDDITRVGGRDRYETAAMIDDEMAPGSDFGHEKGTGRVFIATGENFPDALSASGFAAASRVPILLVKKNEIPKFTQNALDEGDADKITIVGGTGVITNDVRSDLEVYSDNIERVGGADRFQTAVDLAKDVWGVDNRSADNTQRFVFAKSTDFPDALTGAGLVANESLGIGGVVNAASPINPEAIPTLLTETGSLNQDTENYLEDLFENNGINAGIQSFILGEKGAISSSTEEDIAAALSDGDFEPTNKKPEIDDSEVKVNDVEEDDCDNNVARADCDETITISISIKDIKNDDGSVGDVEVDTTVLGEDDSETYVEDHEVPLIGCSGDDCLFRDTIEVDTDDDDKDELNPDVSLEITAKNQAGTDTANSEKFDIYN